MFSDRLNNRLTELEQNTSSSSASEGHAKISRGQIGLLLACAAALSIVFGVLYKVGVMSFMGALMGGQ